MQLFMKLPAELCITPVHYIFEWVGSWYGGILVLIKELLTQHNQNMLIDEEYFTKYANNLQYYNRLVSRINPSLLLKIILLLNITMNKGQLNGKLYAKDYERTNLIKHG